MSVVVSGIHDETERSCLEAHLQKHTIEHSLGIFGQLKRLPGDEVLQLTTMCGHGLISTNLVKSLADQVKKGKKTARDASIELARQCQCGVFNHRRAEKLLENFL